MNRVMVALAVLLYVGGPSAASGDTGEEGHFVGPSAIDEASTETAGSFVAECKNCHLCVIPGAVYTTTTGASTIRTPQTIYECEPLDSCLGCNPEEEDDRDTEVALTKLIESGGENLLGWVDEYRGEFALSVVGSTLQISRQCGQAITWLALGEPEMTTVTELLEL